MLALNGAPSEVDAFMFHLARELGKTLAEIGEMSHEEYVLWRAYYTAKHAMENMKPRGGST